MNGKLLLYFLILSPCFLFAQTGKPAKLFRTGMFEYVGEHEGYKIKRTRTRQIEFNPKTKDKIVLKISWISDNEYILKFVKSGRSKKMASKSADIHATITVFDAESYTAKWTTTDGAYGVVQIRRIK